MPLDRIDEEIFGEAAVEIAERRRGPAPVDVAPVVGNAAITTEGQIEPVIEQTGIAVTE